MVVTESEKIEVRDELIKLLVDHVRDQRDRFQSCCFITEDASPALMEHTGEMFADCENMLDIVEKYRQKEAF